MTEYSIETMVITNFGKVNVSTGYDNGTNTFITLISLTMSI